MKIIGIDPGIGRTGWGIITSINKSCSPEVYGCITTSAKQSPEDRMRKLYDDLEKIIKKNKPDEAAIEKLFFNTNTKTAMTVGQASGAILLALTKQNIPIHHYTPLEVKVAITSYGRAQKSQIQLMVKSLLNLRKIPTPDDVSDALAVSLTHACTHKLK